MKKFLDNINNILVGGVTVLFISFNGMFYSIFDKNDTISIYSLLFLSMIFYLIILIIYSLLKSGNDKQDIENFKVLELVETNSVIHLILKQNNVLTLNTVCSIYFTEKNGYETFKGIGYVYNIAKDKKIDIKLLYVDDNDFINNCSKLKKNIIIKTNLNIENIQYLGGHKYE